MLKSPTAKICVSVCESKSESLAAAISQAESVADLVELRLDFLSDVELEAAKPIIAAALAKRRCPFIITFRPAEQGGARELSLYDRILFRLQEYWWHEGRTARADFIDLEHDFVSLLTQRTGLAGEIVRRFFDWQRIIGSYHDFSDHRQNLDEVYDFLARTPSQVIKLAIVAHDATDCLPIFKLIERARHDGRNIIAIAMGEAGLATRILGPARGSFLTYASLEDDRQAAPGQISFADLRDVYRVNQLDEATEITGLLGWPVAHSISHRIHNTAFAAIASNSVYIPFAVKDLVPFMKRMVHPRTREIDWKLRGLSVTAPHKSAIIELLDTIDPNAREIGAVNTVTVIENSLHGSNTDADAFITPLLQCLGDLHGARCAVVGTGGAARAAVWALKKAGAVVTVWGRSSQSAEAVAERFGAIAQQLDAFKPFGFDVVVNATPLGTRGSLESQSCLTSEQLVDTRLAYDLVYNPKETVFLKEAKSAGCQTLGGLPMLVAQAAAQFSMWMGRDAPLAVMREAAETTLRK